MIAQFALRLICGMSLMWALMPRRQVTSGFFRIQMLVVMGLGVLAALTAEQPNGSERTPILSTTMFFGLSVTIAVVGFLGSVLWTLERRGAGEWISFLLLALSAGMAASMNLTQEVIGSRTRNWNAWLTPLSDLSGAAVLGGAVVGMLLGHWYLTATTMSIEPLKRVNLFLGIAGFIRLFVSAGSMLSVWSERAKYASVRSIPPEIMSIPPMWLGMRWLAGIFGPIVVSLMVWQILRYRNTQAATGVLFVGVILVFIGDMTAALLLSETKWPL